MLRFIFGAKVMLSKFGPVGFLAVVIVLTSCRSNEFTGSSGKIPAVEKKQPETEEPISPEKPSTIEVPKDDTKPEVETEDETKEDTDPEIGESETKKPSLIDIINGLKKILIPNDTIKDENRIVFGGSKGFHIGDANFNPNSNCSTRLKFHNINGTKYFFEFEVTKDDTTIELAINEVCGVDYSDSNFAAIEDASGISLQRKPIPNNDTIKYEAVTLKAGKYKMIVESTPNPANNGDRDDFMVKKLEIKSNKQIIAGKIGAQ
jgi:hypothetical protein